MSPSERQTQFDLTPFEGVRARILVVDDERGPRESLRMILAPSYEVALAENGTSALEQLRSQPFDLVTLDLNMPGMRGQELMSVIRSEYPLLGVILVSGSRSFECALEGIRCGVDDFVTKPFDVVQVSSAVARTLAQRTGKRRLIQLLGGIGELIGAEQGSEDVLRAFSEDPNLGARLASMVSGGAATAGPAIPANTLAFLEVLAEAIEQRDVLMRGHAQRVGAYTAVLAEAAGLDGRALVAARVAGFLHDLGKVAVPSPVLSSRERFNDADRDRMRGHAEAGERLLRPLGLPPSIASALRHHHERWDGAGYPDGLSGEQIPLSARLVSVADAYDAMTCDRPYLPVRSDAEARTELRKYAGTQFDPRLVEQLDQLASEGHWPEF